MEYFSSHIKGFLSSHFESGEGPGDEMAHHLCFHRAQTSEAFFVLLSRVLFNVKWKNGQGCIKKLM